jgi:hypothetical protein
MKCFKIRKATVLFLKIILVAFTIVYCCIILLPEQSVKRSTGYQDGSPKVIDHPISITRPSDHFQTKFPSFGPSILPVVLDLIKTITYQDKAAIFSRRACHVFFAITTINAP